MDTPTIFAKGVPAHASTPTLGVNAAGVTCACLEKTGFVDDFWDIFILHILEQLAMVPVWVLNLQMHMVI